MKKIYIEGMSCEHCTNHVRSALADLEGMHAVKDVNLSGKFAVVDCSTDDETIKNAISDEGYQVTKIEKC